jgi:hypothetical protein
LIRALELGNARLFEGAGWEFPWCPLTILCGTNSAGKSTLLKIPLRLRQTLGVRQDISTDKPTVRFTGSQVDLGNYESFISHNDKTRDLSIGMTVDGEMPSSFLAQLRSSDGSSPSLDSVLDVGREREAYQLRCLFHFGLEYPDIENIELEEDQEGEKEEREAESSDIDQAITSEARPFLKRAEFAIRQDGETLLEWEVVLHFFHSKLPFYKLHVNLDYLEKASGLEIDPDTSLPSKINTRCN